MKSTLCFKFYKDSVEIKIYIYYHYNCRVAATLYDDYKSWEFYLCTNAVVRNF